MGQTHLGIAITMAMAAQVQAYRFFSAPCGHCLGSPAKARLTAAQLVSEIVTCLTALLDFYNC
jgi:hypothetical protein